MRLLRHRLLVKEQVVTTDVRLLHLSMEILRPRTKDSLSPQANGTNMREKTTLAGVCHVTISLIFTRLGFRWSLIFAQQGRHLAPLPLIVEMPSNKNWTTYRESRFQSVRWRRHCGRLWLQFRKPSKFLHLTPEPKPVSVSIAALKAKLSPAAEKFWQCAKEVASRRSGLRQLSAE